VKRRKILKALIFIVEMLYVFRSEDEFMNDCRKAETFFKMSEDRFDEAS